MYPDGLYLGIKYAAGAEEWNVDIWFVDEPHRQPDLQDLKSLLPRIDEPARSAILRIKHDLVGTPRYGTTINGLDIYTAVLDGSVKDTQSFESWLRERRGAEFSALAVLTACAIQAHPAVMTAFAP